MKQRKKIQSRLAQRRKLETGRAELIEGRKLRGKEVQTLGYDEYSSDALSSMLALDPGYSKNTLGRALEWLNAGYKNGDTRSFDVRARWDEFQAFVGAWRKNLRLEMGDSSKDRHARREAKTLLTLANAWAAGHLPAVRTCMECAEFFLAERSNQQFCKDECRSAFYHKMEALHPGYKARKAREAVVRRRNAKEGDLKQYVRNLIGMYGSLPKAQLDAELAAAARKFKVTLALVKQIARSLSPI